MRNTSFLSSLKLYFQFSFSPLQLHLARLQGEIQFYVTFSAFIAKIEVACRGFTSLGGF